MLQVRRKGGRSPRTIRILDTVQSMMLLSLPGNQLVVDEFIGRRESDLRLVSCIATDPLQHRRQLLVVWDRVSRPPFGEKERGSVILHATSQVKIIEALRQAPATIKRRASFWKPPSFLVCFGESQQHLGEAKSFIGFLVFAGQW